MRAKIKIDKKNLADFCKRWKIVELSFFGSVLRDDFGPDSDVDILVSYTPDARWSLWDHVKMEDELSEILRRKVDLVSRRAIEASENWIRRNSILESLEPVIVAG